MEQTSIDIVKKLKSHGYETYWAGGTVRDLLMGKSPKDYDIVTSAKPYQIEELLEKTIPIGKKFGVIMAIKNGHSFEIATFRSDAAYTDGRRPSAVYFTNPREDALRRDFTINGMFYDPIEKKVLDFIGGQEDLNKRILRFIGNPEDRIKEDNLRILRAIRFKNALNLKYASETFKALKKDACLIKNVSAERISDELNKILMLPGRENAFKELDEAGILNCIMPEILELKGVMQPEKYHEEGDVFKHTLLSLEALPDKVSEELAWATLFHDIGKPETYSIDDRIRFNQHAQVGAVIADNIMKRLKFSKYKRDNVKWLVEHHMVIGDIPKMKRTRQAHWVHNPLFPELLELLKADELGSKPKDLSLYHELKKLEEQKIELLPLPEKLITGEEIIKNFSLKAGPEIGNLLQKVHQAQMEEKIKTKKDALDFIRKIVSERKK